MSDRELLQQLGQASISTTHGYVQFAKANDQKAYPFQLPVGVEAFPEK